jgi:hypothetical protein
MKTFSQFMLDLHERYYEPDEKQSRESALQKATRKSKTRARTIGGQSPENQERWAKQYDLTRTKVKHGADNPTINRNVSYKDKDEIEVDAHDDSDVYISHKPSGINYSIVKSDEAPHDDVRTVEWGHDRQNEKMKLSPHERLKIGRTAKRVWDKDVSPRLPKGTVLHNTPSSSYDERGKEKPVNRRAEIYKKSGFGPTDDEGDQFASVGREPSPRQKVKGKGRLKPLDPRKTKTNVEWGKNSDEYED